MKAIINNKKSINGEIKVASDKSISHRGIMLGSISKGKTIIENFLNSDDPLATIQCFKKLGIKININDTTVTINGEGLKGLKKPEDNLYVGNSGTTIRLMSGILVGQNFQTTITGDDSIVKRPMDRIINPLLQMGGNITGINNTTLAPLTIKKSNLKGIVYTQKVPSAQVKSGILLASLYAEDKTTIIEPIKSRNHTEIMLNHFGGNIQMTGDKIISTPVKELYGQKIFVPNDISSAAFFIVAALILDNSNIKLNDVSINTTRIGIIDALIKMGGDIKFENIRDNGGETIADIIVKSSNLKGITIGGDIIPRMIDEIPVFAVAALFADGTTVIKDAEELKVKETNRIRAVVNEITKLKGNIKETEDGMIIEGNNELVGTNVESYKDHRMAMSLAIAGLKAKGSTTINNFDCINISFPDFLYVLNKNIS